MPGWRQQDRNWLGKKTVTGSWAGVGKLRLYEELVGRLGLAWEGDWDCKLVKEELVSTADKGHKFYLAEQREQNKEQEVRRMLMSSSR